MAIKGWKLMGGLIDWSGLPLIIELLGIKDIESFIADLVVIRDFSQDQE